MAELLGGLGEVEAVGGDAVDGVRLEVDQQLDLALGVAGARRHDGGAEVFDGVVDPEAAGEEAVAGHVLEGVAGPDAGGREPPRHDLPPDVEVVGGVADDLGFARGARGRVDAPDGVVLDGEEARRVGPGERLGGGEREGLEVLDAGDVGRGDAGLVEALPVVGHVPVGALDRLDEPLVLAAPQRRGVGGRGEVHARLSTRP